MNDAILRLSVSVQDTTLSVDQIKEVEAILQEILDLLSTPHPPYPPSPLLQHFQEAVNASIEVVLGLFNAYLRSTDRNTKLSERLSYKIVKRMDVLCESQKEAQKTDLSRFGPIFKPDLIPPSPLTEEWMCETLRYDDDFHSFIKSSPILNKLLNECRHPQFELFHHRWKDERVVFVIANSFKRNGKPLPKD